MNGHANPTHMNGHANATASNSHASTSFGFSTRAIHVGSEPDGTSGAVIPAISLSTTYKQDGVGNHKGFEYSRSGNPNRDAFETLLASLESGGSTALAFSSGSSATGTLIQSLGSDAHILSVNDVYGGTFRYMSRVAAETQNLSVDFVDLQSTDVGGASDEEIKGKVKKNTKLVWIETPTNPTLKMISIPRISALIKSAAEALGIASQVKVVVDGTFLSPFYLSSLLLGADIVLHSLTKYVNGHSDVVMGALIFPERSREIYEKVKFLQNATGAVPSAFDSWLAQRGAKTLALRMKQHGTNAVAIARLLRASPHVKDVIYPGLGPNNKAAYEALSPHGKTFVDGYLSSHKSSNSEGDFPYGGMVSFRLAGGAPAAHAFLASTKLFTLAESLGGVESLAELPALMTHGSIPEAERQKIGIGEDLIRLSIGIEEEEDLVEDIRQALESAAKASSKA